MAKLELNDENLVSSHVNTVIVTMNALNVISTAHNTKISRVFDDRIFSSIELSFMRLKPL